MLKICSTQFEDIKIIDNFCQGDIRGRFIKTYNIDQFKKMGMNVNLQEIFYSVSQKDVIRGMHFQAPPHDHDKIVHVIRGSVVDVVLDLRKSSGNYCKLLDIKLSGETPRSLYIPRGFAHGFKCLEDNTVILYQLTRGHSPDCDMGIYYNSIGYDWGISDPIISEKDKRLITLDMFKSPF